MRLIAAGLISLLILGQAALIQAQSPQKKPNLWRTMVIDAGHGGQDKGVHGISGIPEKELSLQIARQLARQVTRRLGMRVILTRDNDNSLSWDKRVAIANNNKADLFISLHANADFTPRTQGLAVYTLMEQNRPAPAAVTDNGPIYWDSAQNNYQQDSLAMAKAIHAQALNMEQVKTRGVFAASLLPLKGAGMPAVLIELGFLSNPQEEEKLFSPEYQKVLVETIVEGLLNFKRQEQNLFTNSW